MTLKEKAMRIKNRYTLDGKIDIYFLCTVILLFVIGVVTMFSASYSSAALRESGPFYFFVRQSIFGAVGIVGMLILGKIDFRVLNSGLAIVAYGVGLFGLLLCFVLDTGSGDQDTSRWIKIFGINIQPSEVAKLTLIIILAYCICIMKMQLRAERGKEKRYSYKTDRLTAIEKTIYSGITTQRGALMLLLCPVIAYCVTVFAQKHLSATIVLLVISFAMISLSGANKWYFLVVAGAAIAVVAVVILEPDILSYLPGFAESRVKAWLFKDDPNYEQLRYQTMNGLYAIASGGLFGVGFTSSKQKQLFVPEPQNDFILSIAIEEMGFVFAVLVLCLFAFLIYRGYLIAVKCPDFFGSLIVMGIMTQIAVQTIVNISVITDTIPNTGMALPFFSYGGSSLIMLFAEMGLVLSVSRLSNIEKV